MKTRNSKLLEMLKKAGKEPHSHDEWIANWKSLYEAFESGEDAPRGFSDIEHAAVGSFLNVDINGTSDHVRSEVCRTLDTFKFPAFLVNSRGRISAQNAKVNSTFDIGVGDNIESLPIALNKSESLRDVVSSVSKSKLGNGDAIFRQAMDLHSSQELTLAVTNSSSESGDAALVFVINSHFSDSAAALVKKHYGLTDAESEVLVSFVAGYSLKDIATDRNRSHATIRTQFNTLMTKMGAHSQASLLRVALSLSDFTNEIGHFSTILEHPHRRRATIMRAGGRMVEIGFSGDPSGTPILNIPNLCHNRFNAKAESALFRAGLYVITVMPPAQGKTDPPSHEQDIDKVRIDDTKTVLDMLNIDSCPVLACKSGSYQGFNIAASLPTRISQIILLGATPPREYWTKYGTGSSYFDSALRISEKYPTMRRIIIAAGMKAWATIGAKQFYKSQLKDTILRSNCDISIIHGANDLMLPIDAMRDFKADMPDRIQLFEFEDAGFTVLLSHTEEVVNLLSKIAKDSEHSHRRSLSAVQ